MNLKQLREEKGITQTELAKQIGVVRSTICFYETEQHSPTPEMLIKLADYFGVSVDYLLGRDSGTVSASVAPMGENLTATERNLINAFRKLPQASQDLLVKTALTLAGEDIPATTLHKRA